MISTATMIKEVPAVGTKSDGVPNLFTRNEQTGRFRGYVAFGEDGDSSALLEVADTPELKARGLMGRRSLPECCGMIFTDLTGGAFWMKGCKIPLDIVFIDKDEVTRIYSMPVDGGVRRYGYDNEETAIELPYGFCSRHGITVGTPCKWRVW